MTSSESLKKDAETHSSLAFQPSGCSCTALLISLAALGVVPVLTAISFRTGAPIWQRLAFAAFTILAILGAVELAMKLTLERVHFAPEGLTAVSVKHLRRRTGFFPRNEILSVTWEKGGGAYLRLRNGQFGQLPGVGRTYQGLANSVRAWLNRTSMTNPTP